MLCKVCGGLGFGLRFLNTPLKSTANAAKATTNNASSFCHLFVLGDSFFIADGLASLIPLKDLLANFSRHLLDDAFCTLLDHAGQHAAGNGFAKAGESKLDYAVHDRLRYGGKDGRAF
jgi:hypothetical protein